MKKYKFTLIVLCMVVLSCSTSVNLNKIEDINSVLVNNIVSSFQDKTQKNVNVDKVESIDKKEEILTNSIGNIIIPGFQTGDYNLTTESFEYIDSIAMVLNNNRELIIIISGHTDNVGDYEYNMSLSKRRANVVKNEFLNRGVQDSQLIVEYFGEECPVISNITEEGRQYNRRVELSVFSLN